MSAHHIYKLYWTIVVTIIFIFSTTTCAFSRTYESPTQLKHNAKEVYLYGYPLVVFYTTLLQLTHGDKVGLEQAAVNQWYHAEHVPPAHFKGINLPNPDILYSSAWLDLAHEPMILTIPAVNRYYIVTAIDAWSNIIASLGQRTPNGQAQNFIIVGPHWQGTIPPHLKKIVAPTRFVWLLSKIQTHGGADYQAVHALQAQFKLTPLHAWGHKESINPLVKTKTHYKATSAPADLVGQMTAEEFLNTLNQLLVDNPLPAKDVPTIGAAIASLGIKPGHPFNINIFDSKQHAAIDAGMMQGREQVKKPSSEQQTTAHGWTWNIGTATVQPDYKARAYNAWNGLGHNNPQDIVYLISNVDAQGQQLSGEERYKIHFTKNQLPPVYSFWSITLYNVEGYFVTHAFNNQSLTTKQPIHYNPDGSLDIYIQAAKPAQGMNWLATPKEDFKLLIRLYSPKSSVLNGQWLPPAIQKVALNDI